MPKLLTLAATALDAIAALRELHRICLAMDADRDGERPDEAEYQAAMRRAKAALDAAPVPGEGSAP